MKLFKKSLSVLMAVVIALGTLSAAVWAGWDPSKVPSAVMAELENIKAAINAAADSGALAQYTYSRSPMDDPNEHPASGYIGTVTDNSSNGEIFKVAQMFEKLLQNNEYVNVGPTMGQEQVDGVRGKFPHVWWAEIYMEDFERGMGLTGSRGDLINALTNMKTPNGSDPRSINGYSKDVSWPKSVGSNPADSSVTVSRLELAALRTDVADWDALAALPADGVITSMKYGMNAGIYSPGTAASFNFFLSRQETTYGRSNTLVNKLKAYYNYFFAGNVMEIDPFELDPGDVTALVADNNAAVANLSGFPTEIIEKFFPQNEEAVEFMKACNEADTITSFFPNIDYFQDAPTALLGSNFIANIASQVANPGSFYDAADLSTMYPIWAVMEPNYQRLLDTSAAGKTKLTALYAMDFTAITDARAVLESDIQRVELADKKNNEIDPYHATHSAEIDDVKNIDDTTLGNLYTQYKDFIEFLDKYPQERIDEIFTEGTVYIHSSFGALFYEKEMRRLTIDLANIYDFFSANIGEDLTKIGTEDLITLLNEAGSYSADFFKEYDATKDLFTEADLATIYGAYPQNIPAFVDRINLTLEGRFTVQVSNAMDLYTDVGAVSWENVALLRRMIGFVEPAIFNRLVNSAYISEKTRADYLWLFNEILEEFNEFVKNGGYHSYKKYDTKNDYPVRDPYADDIVAGHRYDVTNEKLGSVINPLEQFLLGDEFKTLLADVAGVDLDIKGMITGAVDGLWSDAIINTVVGILYPTILSMLEEQWEGLPNAVIEKDGDGNETTNVTVTKRPLHDALTDNKTNDSIVGATSVTSSVNNTARDRLRLFPDMLAAGLDPNFTEAIIALKAAQPENGWSNYPSNVWKHSAVADADGILTLKWGVDDPADATFTNYDSGKYATYADVPKEERFLNALSAATGGMWNVIAALLCGQQFTARVHYVASISGWTNNSSLTGNPNIRGRRLFLDLNVDSPANGYAELLTPIFEALLGDDTGIIPTVADLKGYTSCRQLMDAIFNPILYFVRTKLADAPLSTLLGILPNIAYAISMDNVMPLLKTLVLNLSYVADGQLEGNIPVCGWDATCVGFMSNQNMAIKDSLPVDIYGLLTGDASPLGDLDLGVILSDVNAILDMVLEGLLPGVKLPLFNTGKLAAMGTLLGPIPSKRPSGTRYRIEADQADVLLFLLQYVLGVVEDPVCMDGIFKALAEMKDENGQPKMSDLRENKTVMDIINRIASHPDDVIAAVVELLVPKEYAMEKYSWLYTNQASATVTNYTSLWKKPDANYVINNLDDFLDGIMKLWGVYDSNGVLFSINNLLKGVIDGLYTNENLTKIALLVKNTIGGLNLDAKIADLINDLVAVDINYWNKYSEGHNWGFTDGDRNGFFSGIVELLRPALPLLRFLLTQDGDLAVFDLVKANGYDGYAQGILPLLEALGAKNIKTPAEFKAAAEANPDNMITAILVPLMGVLDEVSSDPVGALLKKLPAIFYFLQSGGLNTAINNTIQALNVVIDTIRPVLPLNLFDLLKIDLNIDYYTLIDMLFDLVNEKAKTNFSVPREALSTFLVGNVTKFTSLNGDTAYTLVPEAEDSLTALLRFVVNFIYYRDNRDAIIDLLTGLVGMKSDFIKQADALFDGLRKLYLKHNGADVVLNTLLNTLKVTDAFTKTTQNLLDGFNKNWVAILAVMKNSGVSFLAEFAESLEGFLDKNFKDILDPDGKASSGLLKFFSAVGSWFKRIWDWMLRYIFFGWIWMK